jgi:hypothetical protein
MVMGSDGYRKGFYPSYSWGGNLPDGQITKLLSSPIRKNIPLLV